MALEKWKHSLYGNEWTCLCFNKTFCRDTEIWISYGFYVSWNATFLLIFFQTFTNINTILGSWAIQKTGDKPDLAQRMLFANLSSSLPSLMCYTMGFTFYILVDHYPGSIRILKIINAFPALLLPFPSLWPPTPCSTAPLSLSVPDSPNGKKNYPFTVRKLAFWRESLASKQYLQEYKPPQKRVLFLWCFLFLWFQISPATAEWQYFRVCWIFDALISNPAQSTSCRLH